MFLLNIFHFWWQICVNQSFVIIINIFIVDSSLNISPSKKRRKNNRIKVRKKIKTPIFSSSSTNQCPQPLRQRLELKGPRVKHVCRSASVALGQPIATFPSVDGKEDTESNKHIPKTLKESDRTEKKDCIKEKESQKHNDENTVNHNIVNATQQSHLKRGKPQQNISTSNFQVVSNNKKLKYIIVYNSLDINIYNLKKKQYFRYLKQIMIHYIQYP